MKKPRIDVILIGAMKSGTTSLFHAISQSPHFNTSKLKEPMFFNSYDDWQDRLEQYHKLWDWESGGIKIEGSTDYSKMHVILDKNVPERLYQYNPDIKLIYIVRHPLDRAVSSYIHKFRRGKIKSKIEESFSRLEVRNPIFGNSCYGHVLEAYLKYFKKEQILVLDFDEFKTNKEMTLSKVAKFTGLPESALEGLSVERRNVSSIKPVRKKWIYKVRNIILRKGLLWILPKSMTHHTKFILQKKPTLPDKVKQEFITSLESDIKLFEKLTGWELTKWRKF